jgi:hypothetical protein
MNSKHRHRAATSAKAHALGTCAEVAIPFCECGEFKVSGVWIENGSAVEPFLPAKRVLTLSEVAHRLGLSDRTMERLIAGRLIYGRKVCFRGKRRWLFTDQEIWRFRRSLALVPASATIG